MKKLLTEVLALIKPTPQEEKILQQTTQNILTKLTIPHTEAFPGGSGAKGTWLKGNHDIDIYVRFSKEHYAGKDISKILGKHLKKHYTITKLHGSRDYYQTEINGITVEFIPLFNIKHPTEATNITDISPLHTLYVQKHNNQDDIRLFKAFCKAQDAYGAESYKQGLSGYVCEILVIHYGSFQKTINSISRWKKKTYIGNKNFIKNLNKAKTVSPLILIDPVDDYRNAAAAISQEQYDKLRAAAKNFLKKPSKEYFIKQPLTYETLRKKYPKERILAYKIEPLKGKKDVIGAKLRKGITYLTKKLQEEEFTVREALWTWEDAAATYYFILDPNPLPYIKKHEGPPLKNTRAVDAFIKKWKKQPLKKTNTQIYVELPRQHQLPEEYLTQLIRTDKTLSRYLKKIRKEP